MISYYSICINILYILYIRLIYTVFPVSGSCLEDQFEVMNDLEDKLSVVGQHCGRIVLKY